MNPDQIAGSALVVLAVGMVAITLLDEIPALWKFAVAMRDKFYEILGHRPAGDAILPGVAEAAWEAEVDLLAKANRDRTQEAILRIDAELNQILWERGTMQGERAPVLNMPPTEKLTLSTHLEDGVLLYTDTGTPVDLAERS